MSDNLREGLGQSAADAVSAAASGELRALGQTLELLRGQLDTLSGTVGASGAEAAGQIRAAGADFAQAAGDIKAAFEQLTTRVDGVGARLSEQNEAAGRAQAETLERILAQLEQTQAGGAEAMGAAVRSLQGAGAEAATRLQQGLGEALAMGVAESRAVFHSVLEESGDAFRDSALGLSRAVGDAAGRVEQAGAAIERGGRSAENAASGMQGVADGARAASTALGDAAQGFGAAATPVAQAARSINEAAGRVAQSLQDSRTAEIAALSEMRTLAEGVRQTHTAAEAAWRDYRARFEGVDKSLEGAAIKLVETLDTSLKSFGAFASKFDSELAKSVSKLDNKAAVIEDHAEGLEETLEALKKYAASLDRFTRRPLEAAE